MKYFSEGDEILFRFCLIGMRRLARLASIQMSKKTYNNQTITRYLLGSLAEAEAERFDELSFTDDEFAEALSVAEKDLVDAYVQGELTGVESEQFKTHYLASPLRREKVEFAQAFGVFAEKNAAAQTAEVRAENPDQAATKRNVAGWFSGLNIFTAPRPALSWGFAVAALALIIAGGWLVVENTRLRQQMSQTQARRDALGQREQELQKELEGQRAANATTGQELARVREERQRLEQELKKEQEQQRLAELRRPSRQQQPASPGGVSTVSFILAPQLRGVGQIPMVFVPDKTDYVKMRLELEPNDYPAYRVALLDQSSNQTLWRSNKLKAMVTGDGKTLSISFPAGLLRPQVHVLRVSGVSANGASEIVSDYPFRVVK